MFGTGGTFVTGKSHPEEVQAVFATHELLPILAITQQLGRSFASEDDEADGERTVMISDGYWHSHFGGNRAVLGRRINIDGNQTSVIGVLPPSFEFMDKKPDLLLPLRLTRSGLHLLGFTYLGVGRLKPGVTIRQASADFARVLLIVPKQFPPPPGFTLRMYEDARIAPNLRPLKKDLVGDIGNTLWLLMATVGIVLLIACSNVANLLLVRTDARQQELAIRAALGAAATRIARELLFESLLLGIIAGAVGLALCRAALKLLAASDLVHLPRSGNIRIDGWVLLFTFVVSIGFSALFGLIPVLRYVRPRLADALRSGGRSMSHSRNRQQVRSFLVVLQVALALVLLVTSGLMIRTFRNLHNVDPGFMNAHQVQTLRIGITDVEVKEPARVMRMEQAMLDKTKTVNGVVSASIISSVPMGGGESNDPVYAADKTYREGTIAPLRRYKSIAPGYFATMGQRMLAGRDFTWADIYNGGTVAIVSENTARDLWGAPQAALGKRIRPNQKDDWREVIGVVADEHSDGVDKPAPTIVYWPLLTKNFEGDAAGRATLRFIRDSQPASGLLIVSEGGSERALEYRLEPPDRTNRYSGNVLQPLARTYVFHAAAPGDCRRHGPVFGASGHIRRDFIRGLATDAGSRDPACPRCADCTGHNCFRPQRPDSVRCGLRLRACRGACANTIDEIAAVFCQPVRPTHLRCNVGELDVNRGTRQLPSSAEGS